MDLLITPNDPAFETEDVPFFPDAERWGGERFLTYGTRRRLHTVEECEELSSDALHGFMQTWLFFGLLAEMLGLNELPGGLHALDPVDAKRERDVLYKECILEKEYGRTILSGRKALESGPLMVQRTRMAAAVTGGTRARLEYLDQCLELVARQVAIPALTSKIDRRVRFSIAALGELFAMALQTFVSSRSLPMQLKAPSMAWTYGYLAEGCELEASLLHHGWCISEVEKIRSEWHGLNSMHYVSRLKKTGLRRDHTGCHRYGCSAFQIQMEQYQPAHTHLECNCDLAYVDIDEVVRILRHTDTYPVLAAAIHTKASFLEREVKVEPFTNGVPYIAISHVWADGLGNPASNSLPSCQVTRLRRLVAELQQQIDPQWAIEKRAAYRVWVDPLCCPVEWDGKKISLERIADVYRNSTHTLVLDATVSNMSSEGIHAAELLLRILSCSPWMRRLWTFQEGSLPQSLYIQFGDRAVSWRELLEQLYQASSQDLRYKRLWTDCWLVLDTFAQFSPWKARPEPYDDTRNILLKLQWALNSRSVSVPSDEPLCVATLLGLDVTQVLSESSAQRRMAAVWKMAANMLNGIPPRAIFCVDNPLDIEGFRWAPRSLLAADSVGDSGADVKYTFAKREFRESSLDLSHRYTRFGCVAGTTMAELVLGTDVNGLRGRYPGFRIRVQPHEALCKMALGEEVALHPWTGVLPWVVEDSVYVREEETGIWYHMCDYHLSRMIRRWTPEQTREWQLSVGQRLCGSMHNSRSAVIRNTNPYASSQEGGLLVSIERDGDEELFVRRGLNVLIAKLSQAESLVANTMVALAAQLASEDITMAFLAQQSSSPEWSSVRNQLKERMQQLVSDAWEARPGFATAAAKTHRFGDDVRTDGWVLFAMAFSHRASLVRTPNDQVWLVD